MVENLNPQIKCPLSSKFDEINPNDKDECEIIEICDEESVQQDNIEMDIEDLEKEKRIVMLADMLRIRNSNREKVLCTVCGYLTELIDDDDNEHKATEMIVKLQDVTVGHDGAATLQTVMDVCSASVIIDAGHIESELIECAFEDDKNVIMSAVEMRHQRLKQLRLTRKSRRNFARCNRYMKVAQQWKSLLSEQ